MSSKSEVLAWKRLVRYNSSSDGSVKYGEPILEDANADIAALAQQGKLKVHVLEGSNPLDAKPTSQEDHVKSLLGLLRVEDVPIIRCIDLNYKTHIKETSRALPECPALQCIPSRHPPLQITALPSRSQKWHKSKPTTRAN